MSVKFIRTCNRCGKVLEDIKGDDKNVVNYHGHNNVYFTITSNEHPEFSLQEYDLCEDCHKDFVQFMKGGGRIFSSYAMVCKVQDGARGRRPYNQDDRQRK